MTEKQLRRTFKNAVIEIWEETAERDYRNYFYHNEDSMKNRLYKKITEKLGERFFTSNNVRLYTEFHVPSIGFSDMALVDITDNDYKKWKILTILELKNKYLDENTTEAIKKDYFKITKYLEKLNEIDAFMISLNIDVDIESKGESWTEHFEKDFSDTNLVELILDEDKNEEIVISGYDWSKKQIEII